MTEPRCGHGVAARFVQEWRHAAHLPTETGGTSWSRCDSPPEPAASPPAPTDDVAALERLAADLFTMTVNRDKWLDEALRAKDDLAAARADHSALYADHATTEYALNELLAATGGLTALAAERAAAAADLAAARAEAEQLKADRNRLVDEWAKDGRVLDRALAAEAERDALRRQVVAVRALLDDRAIIPEPKGRHDEYADGWVDARDALRAALDTKAPA